ncbi:MAG TPA: hypothetical protein VLM40_19350 [Gemmata sp.]|nr:hypothetical protein [Gemmata sp.]
MSARILIAVAVATVLVALPARAQAPAFKVQPGKPVAADAPILKKLQDEKVVLDAGTKLDKIPLYEMLHILSKRHEITFVIMEEEFKAAKRPEVKDQKTTLAALPAKGMSLHQFLTLYLAGMDARYRVRPDYVEIVPLLNVAMMQPAGQGKKADPTAALLETLFEQEVQLDENTVITDVPLYELLQRLTKRYGVQFVIQEPLFKEEAMRNDDLKEAKARIAVTDLHGMSLHQFLTTVLGSMDATYLVKGHTVEIVPKVSAEKLAKPETRKDSGVPLPLVSLIAKEKPLNETVALLAKRYDLTVVVAPQAGDARTAFITARILNVPADEALELIALQADLRVVRKHNSFLVTSREHADEIFGEQIEKQRQAIELEKLRSAPAPHPLPGPMFGGFPPPPPGFPSPPDTKGKK